VGGSAETEKSQEGGLGRVRREPILGGKVLATLAMGLWLAGACTPTAFAQVITRLLLESGDAVPGHGGFAFGPFAGLSMNGNQDIIFLSSLRSPRTELRAVVRSTGVSFTVLAFQGLVAPNARTTYDAFSAPSMNDAGVVAFTATLISDQSDMPKVMVVRQEGAKARGIASNLDAPPGQAGATFEEFSAPLVTSDGDVLFGARWSGKSPGSGLFLWSPRGLQALQLPEGMTLSAKDLLEPFFFSKDEAAFLPHGASPHDALEQFFRAIAIRTLQDLKPPPEDTATTEILAARPGIAPVQMLFVLLEGANIQTAPLLGDPSKPVLAKKSPGLLPTKPVSGIESLTIGPRGDLLFAAAPDDAPNDLGLFCYCDCTLNRLTTPEDFQSITQAAPGKPILSLTSDTQQNVAFIAPTASGEATAIYVAGIP